MGERYLSLLNFYVLPAGVFPTVSLFPTVLAVPRRQFPQHGHKPLAPLLQPPPVRQPNPQLLTRQLADQRPPPSPPTDHLPLPQTFRQAVYSPETSTKTDR